MSHEASDCNSKQYTVCLASTMRKDPHFQLQVLNPTLKCLKGETCIARGNNLPFHLS